MSSFLIRVLQNLTGLKLVLVLRFPHDTTEIILKHLTLVVREHYKIATCFQGTTQEIFVAYPVSEFIDYFPGNGAMPSG